LPDDVTKWKKEDFFRARQENQSEAGRRGDEAGRANARQRPGGPGTDEPAEAAASGTAGASACVARREAGGAKSHAACSAAATRPSLRGW